MIKNKLKVNIITLFPQLLEPHFKYLPIKKAIEMDKLNIELIDLKNYAIDKRGTVDDKPYGGGPGMLLRIEPIFNALKDNKISKAKQKKIILLSPKGKKYDQAMAKTLLTQREITLISGRYEGIDDRIRQYITDEISIGDYVLSGGELPSLVILESLARLLEGVLEKSDASQLESFENGLFEYPQYTRPEVFRKQKVPKILLSGDHKKIAEWRKMHSTKIQ